MTTVPIFHVWTRGGGKDRRFRHFAGFRNNSGAIVCGVDPSPALNVIGRESGDALAAQTADGVGPKSYRICPACSVLILADLEQNNSIGESQ